MCVCTCILQQTPYYQLAIELKCTWEHSPLCPLFCSEHKMFTVGRVGSPTYNVPHTVTSVFSRELFPGGTDCLVMFMSVLHLLHSNIIKTAFVFTLTCICGRPRENQPYCAGEHFLVKTTIANYNLWTRFEVSSPSRNKLKYTRITRT